MSQLVLSDDGIVEILKAWSQGTGTLASAWHCHLSLSNITPTKATVFADFASEASFPGYAAINLFAAGTWPAPSVAAHVASSQFTPALIFTQSAGAAPQTVYCVYFTDAADAKLMASARLDGAPYTMQNLGDTITETPTISTQSLYG